MHAKLIDYFYGGLDNDEMLDVEALIATDQQARRLIDAVQKFFSPLEGDRHHVEAPSGLAVRTCRDLWSRSGD